MRERIYVIIYFPGTGKAVALDRNYNFLTDDKDIWGKVEVGDIIETDNDFYAGQMLPQWANDMVTDGFQHIAMWTNYYER